MFYWFHKGRGFWSVCLLWILQNRVQCLVCVGGRKWRSVLESDLLPEKQIDRVHFVDIQSGALIVIDIRNRNSPLCRARVPKIWALFLSVFWPLSSNRLQNHVFFKVALWQYFMLICIYMQMDKPSKNAYSKLLIWGWFNWWLFLIILLISVLSHQWRTNLAQSNLPVALSVLLPQLVECADLRLGQR